MSIINKNSLVGYWSLDGYAYDRSGNNNHGTVTGALVVPSQNPAIPASLAYKFNGSSDVISVANSSSVSNFGTAMTICFWIKSDALSALARVIHKENASPSAYTVYTFGGTNPALQFGANGTGLAVTTSTWNSFVGKWKFATLVYNGTNTQWFINGVKDGSSTAFSSSIVTNTGALTIGNATSGANINGSLQEVSIFNKSLSTQEIRSIYNQSKRKYTTNKASWLASIANAFRTSDFFQFFFK